jgi:hypothetical protein
MRRLAAFLVAVLSATSSAAQIRAPGLDLDRLDLADVAVAGPAQIRGLKPGKLAYGVSGYMVGGQFAQPTEIYACWNCGSKFNSTLAPLFAWGALTWFATPASSESFFLGASIFKPDSVKRTGNASRSRIQLKQKNSLGIFISAGIPGGESTTRAVAGCKGQADLRDNKPSRFKMSCKPGALDAILAIGDGFGYPAANDEQLRALLKLLGLKPKVAFSLELPPAP